MIVISHPTGNANVRAALQAFFEHRVLRVFFTTISWNSENRFARFLPLALRTELERRSYTEIPHALVRSRPYREIGRHLSERFQLRTLCEREEAPFSVDSVYRDLDRHVAHQIANLHDSQIVYSYEDGALATFEMATRLGLTRIYDLPIGYWKVSREIAEIEASVSPDWAGTLNALKDSPFKCERKDQELHLAQKIIVASEFTKSTLRQFPGYLDKEIVVIPYGAPPPALSCSSPRRKNSPLRVLYVGALSQRKGLSYMVEAVSSLGAKVQLTLIGRPTLPTIPKIEEMCNSYRWIPSLPHHRLLEEMSNHDVLLFPSLFEGFGLVITEALSRGLAVISTPNTCAPDVLRHGKDGFIVPIRSSEEIAARLLQLADDTQLLEQMKASALERAGQLRWDTYQCSLMKAVLPG
jgi:glycosyltransferase involved in cell wall biosynthesis